MFSSLNNPPQIIPDYSAGVEFTSGETAPANGVVKGTSGFNTGVGKVHINGVEVAYWNTASNAQCGWYIIVGKGDAITYTNASPVYFFPFKGVN